LDCAEGIQDLIKHLDKELGCPVSIVNWQELKGEPTLESKEKVDTAVRDALENLVDYVERNTCRHENTHRGGVLWTICDDCGMKWADDRGGFPGYATPRRKHELHC